MQVDKLRQRLEEGDLDPQDLDEEIQKAISLSRFVGGATVFAMGGDVLTAAQTAANAAEENSFARLLRALAIASTISTAYDTYDTYQTTLKQTGDKEQAATAAFATLCVDVATGYVTAGVGKVGIKFIGKTQAGQFIANQLNKRVFKSADEAWNYYLKSNPKLQKAKVSYDNENIHFRKTAADVEKKAGEAAKPGVSTNKAKAVEQAQDKTVNKISLEHKEGMDIRDFDRKSRALQDLADRGKLVKTQPVRDPSITVKYRENILDAAKSKWKTKDPEKFKRIKEKIKNMDADHLHELQLGGIDHGTALGLLSKKVNRSIGSQIRHQTKDLPIGTKIDKVEIKGPTK